MVTDFMVQISSAAYLVPFLVSFLICLTVVVTRSLHLHKTSRRDDVFSVQATHRAPTPRIGGIAILLGVALSWVIFADSLLMLALLVSALPVYAAGLIEDLGRPVRPRIRLAAGMVSSLVAIVLLQVWISRTDIAPLDSLVAFAPLGILVTVIWGAGLCQSFNLIDGMNGLAASTAVIISAGLWAIASMAGDTLIAFAALSILTAVCGFLVFNWPFGKLFMGDAGAYMLGHLLTWLSLLLAARNPQISMLALALPFAWPIFDTLFAIYRRFRSGHRIDQPDRLHFHQLVMRELEIFGLGRQRRGLANSLTTVLMVPLIAAPVFAAVRFWHEPLLAALSGLAIVTLYLMLYRVGVALARLKPALATRRRPVTPFPAE